MFVVTKRKLTPLLVVASRHCCVASSNHSYSNVQVTGCKASRCWSCPKPPRRDEVLVPFASKLEHFCLKVELLYLRTLSVFWGLWQTLDKPQIPVIVIFSFFHYHSRNVSSYSSRLHRFTHVFFCYSWVLLHWCQACRSLLGADSQGEQQQAWSFLLWIYNHPGI